MWALGSAVYRSATRLWANQATNWAMLWTNPVLLRMINPDLTQVSWKGPSAPSKRDNHREGLDIVKHWSRFRVKILNGHAVAPLFSNMNPRLPILDVMFDLYWIATMLLRILLVYNILVLSSLPSWLEGHTGECKEGRKKLIISKKKRDKNPRKSQKNKNNSR